MKELTGYIKFIHSDGKEHHFVTERNPLGGAQMYSWDNWRGCWTSDLRSVRSIVRNIHKNAKVISSTI